MFKNIKESFDVVSTAGRAQGFEAIEVVLVPLFVNAIVIIIFVVISWLSWEFPKDEMLVFRVAVAMVFFYLIPATAVNYIHNKLD